MKTLALALIYVLAASMIASFWVAADLGEMHPVEASLLAGFTFVVTILLAVLGGAAWDDIRALSEKFQD